MKTQTNAGWDTEQLAILSQIRPALNAELDRLSKIPFQTVKTSDVVTSTVDHSLLSLCQQYEAKWPEISYKAGGSRGRKAMEIVMRGQLHRRTDDGKLDIWEVRGHLCSKAGLWCNCEDRAYEDPRYGKLCQHRLAVAMKTNWQGDRNQALLDYLKPLSSESYIDLLVERDYGRSFDTVRVAGYWHVGMVRHDRLSPTETIPVTLPQMQWALTEANLSLVSLPTKLKGYTDYYYRLAPGTEGIPLTEGVFFHRGMTWAMEDRARMKRLDLREIAMNLDEMLEGPLLINLPPHEARRVMELRTKMRQQQIEATTVWANLPEALQVAILEEESKQYAD